MSISKIQQTIQQRQEAGLPITNLSFADYTFYDTPLLLKKVRRAFANVFRYPYYYPSARGEPEALEAVCEYYARLHRETTPENLLLTPSINHSSLYLLRLFFAAGGEVLAPCPYSPYLEEVRGFLGHELKTFPLLPAEGWQINLAALEKMITPKTRAIFLMSPHLPTGAIQKEETLRQLFKIIKGKKIAVIIDESQADFIFNKATLPVPAALADSRQLLVTLQTLSNSFALPGLKLSWIRVDGPAVPRNELLTSLELLSDTFLGVNQLTQGIMPELVRHTRRWRRKFRKTVEKNRDILVSKLGKSPRLRFHYPEGGLFAFVEVLPPAKGAIQRVSKSLPTDAPADAAVAPATPPGATSPEFASAEDFSVALLEKTGVYVHPGHYYGQDSGNFFAVCFLQSPSTLRGSLRKIIKFLRPVKTAK